MQVTNNAGAYFRTGQMSTYKKAEKNTYKSVVENVEATGNAETDWRDMSSEQWNKFVKNLDNYIDDYKAELKELEHMQREAVSKAALYASPEMRTQAASRAALMVAANGHAEIVDISQTKE